MTPPLPERAADTTAENPWPVRLLSFRLPSCFRLPAIWSERPLLPS